MQVWYHVAGIENAAVCYPDPRTHTQVKNHIAFTKGVSVTVTAPSPPLLAPPSQSAP